MVSLRLDADASYRSQPIAEWIVCPELLDDQARRRVGRPLPASVVPRAFQREQVLLGVEIHGRAQ